MSKETAEESTVMPATILQSMSKLLQDYEEFTASSVPHTPIIGQVLYGIPGTMAQLQRRIAELEKKEKFREAKPTPDDAAQIALLTRDVFGENATAPTFNVKEDGDNPSEPVTVVRFETSGLTPTEVANACAQWHRCYDESAISLPHESVRLKAIPRDCHA